MRLRPIFFAVAAACSLAACAPADDTAKDPAAAPTATASRENFEEFARRIATTIDARDPSLLDSALDMDALFRAMTAGTSASEEDRKQLLAASSPGFGLAEQLIKGLGKTGSFRLLRFDWNNGDPKAFYRIITSEGTLNYYDVHLGQREDSKLVVRDVYVYLNDEQYASTMRRALSADPDQEMSRLYAVRVEGTGALSEADSMALLYRLGKYQEIMKYYESLPEASRRNRHVEYYRVFAAQNLGDTVHMRVLEEAARQFAGDPSMDLKLMDYYVRTREFDSALAVTDRLDRRVGGDPYLNLIRAQVAMEKNETAQANDYIQKVIAHDSTLAGPYLALLVQSIREEKYSETAKVLDLVEQRTGIDVDSTLLTQDERMAGFVRSEEFRKWAAGQR